MTKRPPRTLSKTAAKATFRTIVGREQSFVAGSPTDAYLQFMVKDSKKYAATGGWGYSSFDKDGKPTDEATMTSCFSSHQAIKGRDFIFSRYAR